jgi:methyl-accepting chemotaxis protein
MRISTGMRTKLFSVVVLSVYAGLVAALALSPTPRETLTLLILVVAPVLAAVVLLAPNFIVNPVARRASSLGAAVSRFSKGDFGPCLPGDILQSGDELGALARSLESMRSDLDSRIEKLCGIARELKSTESILYSNSEESSGAATVISEIVEAVNERARDLSSSGSKNATMAQSIFSTIKELDSEIEVQSANVTESSASIQQMIANTASVTKNVESLAEYFSRLVGAADDGRDKLSKVTATIAEIAGQSERLSDANQLIKSISSRTNLLAMNAAIEAAHAGSAGGGFAVVADEIRTLAEQSSAQSKEISSNIKTIKEKIDSVVAEAAKSQAAFEIVLSFIASSVGLGQEIKNAMAEQSQGSRQIHEAIGRINTITSQVKDHSSRILGAGEGIYEEMTALVGYIDNLKSRLEEIAAVTQEIQASIESVKQSGKRSVAQAESLNSLLGDFKAAEPERGEAGA